MGGVMCQKHRQDAGNEPLDTPRTVLDAPVAPVSVPDRAR